MRTRIALVGEARRSELNDESEEIGHLTAPPIPIVVDVVSPEIAPSGDLFFGKDASEFAGIVDHFVLPSSLTATGDDLAMAVFVEVPRIATVWEIEKRRIEIDVIVNVVADKVGELVATA